MFRSDRGRFRCGRPQQSLAYGKTTTVQRACPNVFRINGRTPEKLRTAEWIFRVETTTNNTATRLPECANVVETEPLLYATQTPPSIQRINGSACTRKR